VRRSERGSVTVVTVAVLAVLLVFGLGLADLARVFVVAARAQAAADAAALAAAQSLALPRGEDPSARAAEYATRNGASLRSCTCAVGSLDARTDVEMPVGALFLAPDDLVVGASARAVVEDPSA
jgi:DNA topoisomerase-1